jgi:opacity protein-like surface antigen
MKKLLTIACTAAALAAPAMASASNDPATNASKFCKQLAAASGGKHSATYAAAVHAMFPNAKNVTAKNAFGKCVSSKTRENTTETEKAAQQAHSNAAKTCKQQRSSDPAGFATQWGSNRNAYGKCVSATAKKQEQEAAAQEATEDKNTVNAAKTCKMQRSEDRAGFDAQWGTKKNAFGKCVSTTAKAKNDES